MTSEQPPAFPALPTDPDELPVIPGGWREEVIPIGPKQIRIHRPRNPDLLARRLAVDGVCWLSDPGRYQSAMFWRRALERGYQGSVFDESGAEISEPSSRGFQIMKLRMGGRL